MNKKGVAMNQYIGQQFAALRYEKNILVVEETTSAGGCRMLTYHFISPSNPVNPEISLKLGCKDKRNI